jgi:hypothetical protein
MTFDTVDVNGLSPSFKDTAEALAAQTVKLGARRVEAGPFDTKIEGNNYIAVRTKDVRRFSLWLHPSMVDFAKPVRISVNGNQSEHVITESLLGALSSYRRRRNWSLVCHAEIKLTADQ